MLNSSFSLKVVAGPGVSNKHVVPLSEVLCFGRLKSNDFVLANDAAISRRHFEVRVVDGQCWIKDLNSRNGTFLNNLPVNHSELKQGDEIRAGKTIFVFQLGQENLANEPAQVAHQSKIMIRDSQTTECFSPRQLRTGKIAKKSFVDDSFASYFLKLTGRAILINGDLVESVVEKQIPETAIVNSSACLVFPKDMESYRQVLLLSFGSSSIMFFNHTSSRPDFVKLLNERIDKFGSPQTFLSEYFEMPVEIANGFLQGMDLVVGEAKDADSATAIFDWRHSDWLGDLIVA